MTAAGNDNAATVLGVDALAKRWATTRKSILAKIHAGELAAFKVGSRRYRIALAEVLRVESGRAA